MLSHLFQVYEWHKCIIKICKDFQQVIKMIKRLPKHYTTWNIFCKLQCNEYTAERQNRNWNGVEKCDVIITTTNYNMCWLFSHFRRMLIGVYISMKDKPAKWARPHLQCLVNHKLSSHSKFSNSTGDTDLNTVKICAICHWQEYIKSSHPRFRTFRRSSKD